MVDMLVVLWPQHASTDLQYAWDTDVVTSHSYTPTPFELQHMNGSLLTRFWTGERDWEACMLIRMLLVSFVSRDVPVKPIKAVGLDLGHLI